MGVAYFSFIDTDMVSESLDRSPAKLMREARPGRSAGVAAVGPPGKRDRARHRAPRRKAYAPRWVPIPWLRGIIQPLQREANHDTIEEAVKLAEAEAAAGARASSLPPTHSKSLRST